MALKSYFLSLNQLRRQMSASELISSTAKGGLELKITNKFPGERILVLSPHADDEALGCGGTLALYPKRTKVTVIYFSDGTRGTPSGKKIPALAEVRRREAAGAAKILKIDRQIFLNLPDGRFMADKKTATALADTIKKIAPDTVFLPTLFDPNRDHQEVCCFFAAASVSLRSRTQIVSYEIWNPLLPNRLVNITKVVKNKKRAVGAYRSQLDSRRFDQAILALNRYRGEISGAGSFAEAFFACDLKTWQTLFKKIAA